MICFVFQGPSFAHTDWRQFAVHGPFLLANYKSTRWECGKVICRRFERRPVAQARVVATGAAGTCRVRLLSVLEPVARTLGERLST